MLREIVERHMIEREPESRFTVLVLGAACSGKTTVLRHLEQTGFTVHTEPPNPVLVLAIEDPQKFSYQNQLHKMVQLMEPEVLSLKDKTLTSPHFRESGVIATQIYNQYLKDQGFISDTQYSLLKGIYDQHLSTFPKPDLVVFLYADEETIKNRALIRDGLVAHNPNELMPYWNTLLHDLELQGIPIYELNTGESSVEQSEEKILSKAHEMMRK